MAGLFRGERIAVGGWLLLGAVVWNLLYDELLLRETRRYLYYHALNQAGLTSAVSMPDMMAAAVRDSVWTSTLWTSIILAAGLITIRTFARK
jgi:hypothetical protein